MRRAFKHVVLSGVVLSVVLSSVVFLYPKKASAQGSTACAAGEIIGTIIKVRGAVDDTVGVPKSSQSDTISKSTDSTNQWRDKIGQCILKPIAMAMVKQAVDQAGDSVVRWINGGFNGSPKIVLNFGDIFLDAADQAIGSLIEGSDLNWLCSPWSLNIKSALALQFGLPFGGYVREERNLCYLTDTLANAENAFYNGFDDWIRYSTSPRYSEYGAYIIAQGELINRIQGKTSEIDREITAGQGFLSDKKCVKWKDPAPLNPGEQPPGDYVAGVERECEKWEIVTPGKTIAGKLDSVLGQGEIQTAVADEIDEILAAAVNQFASMILQGAGGLLSGSSSRKSYTRRYLGTNNTYNQNSTIPDIDRSGFVDLNDYLLYNQTRENTGAMCRDGVDNDNDGLVDARDPDCASVLAVDQFTNNYFKNENLLLGQRNISSSFSSANSSSGYSAVNALDGITENPTIIVRNNEEINPSMRTDPGGGEWWQVNLGETYEISSIKIFRNTNKNVLETLGDKLTVIVFSAGGQTTTKEIIPQTEVANSGNQNPLVITMPTGTEGNSVFIIKAGQPSSPLEFNEIEVFGNGPLTETP